MIPRERVQELVRQQIERLFPREHVAEVRLPLRGDPAALVNAIAEASGRGCQIGRPTVTDGFWVVCKKDGTLTIRRTDFEAANLGLTWRALPALRTGYLVRFDSEQVVIAANPPEGASEEEAERMLHIGTGDELDQLWRHRASVQGQRDALLKAGDLPPGPRRDWRYIQSIMQAGPYREWYNVVTDRRTLEMTSMHVTAKFARLTNRVATGLYKLECQVKALHWSQAEQIVSGKTQLDRDIQATERYLEHERIKRYTPYLDVIGSEPVARAVAEARAQKRR